MDGDDMNNNTYAFKEVLIGLRKEYLKIYEELNELKKFVTIDNKSIDDIQFFIGESFFKENAELKVDVYFKQSQLQRKIIELKKLLRIYIYPNNTSELVKNNNNEYFVLNDNFKIWINDKFKRDFYDKATKILESDFAKHITTFHDINHRIEPFNYYLNILSTCLDIDAISESSSGPMCRYLAKEDKVILFCKSPYTKKDFINNVFNIRIPKDKFTEYHKNVIEKVDNKNVDIEIIGEINKAKVNTFSIKENTKKLILTKD